MYMDTCIYMCVYLYVYIYRSVYKSLVYVYTYIKMPNKHQVTQEELRCFRK